MALCLILPMATFAVLLVSGHNLAAAICCYVAYTMISTTTGAQAYTILQDIVPNNFLGQVVALYLFLANIAGLGLGLGPLLVGMMNDDVFRVEARISDSIAWVAIICTALACLALGYAQAERRRSTRAD